MPTPTMSVQITVPPQHAALPDVRCDLVWAHEKLYLYGPQTRCQSHFGGQSIALLSFEPLIASAWLNTPLDQLTDRVIPLVDVQPRLADRLSESFYQGDIQSRWGPVPRSAGWAPDKRLEIAIARLRRGECVAAAARSVSLTPRHLARVFAHQLGLRPREFSRITRFRRAILLIKRGASLVDAAANAGFADQSHLTREARAFSGHPPTLLIPRVANVQDRIRGSPLD